MDAERQLNEYDEKLNKKWSYSKWLTIFSDGMVAVCFLVFFILLIISVVTGKYVDFSCFTYIVPSVCALAGATHIYYYNKEKFQNCMKIRFTYTEKLLYLKKQLNLYSKEELQYSIDNSIQSMESETENVAQNFISSSETEQSEISI